MQNNNSDRFETIILSRPRMLGAPWDGKSTYARVQVDQVQLDHKRHEVRWVDGSGPYIAQTFPITGDWDAEVAHWRGSGVASRREEGQQDIRNKLKSGSGVESLIEAYHHAYEMLKWAQRMAVNEDRAVLLDLEQEASYLEGQWSVLKDARQMSA